MVRVPVSRADAVSVLDAVLGNVLQHTPAGTGFRVSLDRTPIPVTVVVDDARPGIAAPLEAIRRGVSGRHDYAPDEGYRVQAFREARDSIVVRFVGSSHVSTVYA